MHSNQAYAGIDALICVAAGNANVSILPPLFQSIRMPLPAAQAIRLFTGLGYGGAVPRLSVDLLLSSIIPRSVHREW